jgi:hypothetical protein
MSPQEFWAIAASKTPEPKVGNLPLAQHLELRALLPEFQA